MGKIWPIVPSSEKFAKWIEYDTNGGCWLWSGVTYLGGYGKMSMGKNASVYAHREMWRTKFGEIPTGLKVCHKCDTPECVNPNHLFLGTHQDNMTDMVAKGRHRKGSRLSENEISTIKKLSSQGRTRREISAILKRYPTTIGSVLATLTQPTGSADLEGGE